MRERLSSYQEQYGDLYNLEATPAESTAYRFAKHDKKHFPDIITAAEEGNGTPYYTNSSHLPVGYTEDIFEALDMQDELHTLYTSGTVFHAFLGEKLPSWKSAASLVRKIAENYKLPYYTMSPTYSICKKHGYINGEAYICPECGEKTEVYSRITGYYRPVQNWNDGKSQEFQDRKVYNIANSHLQFKLQLDENKEEVKQEEVKMELEGELKHILFTTKTCPNCPTAKKALDEVGILYEIVDATENKELVKEFKVFQAPTLVVVGDNGVEKYAGAPKVLEYINSKVLV